MIDQVYLILGFLAASVLFLIWFINHKFSKINKETDKDKILAKWLQSMQVSLEGTNRDMNDRLDNAARYISQVAREVGKMSELGQSMRDLQLFLQSPKIRGNIGEQVLKDLISQAFPKGSFHLQYAFKSGEKVDAAIQTNAGILPIDSKFPMENFKLMNSENTSQDRAAAKRDFARDVKKHIQDISKKYILPDEGTLDFAFMYLPSEAVFNEVSNSEEILEFARKHRIYPVSPNTLYVHLQTVLLSFEGQKIEAKSRQVFRLLRAVQKDYEKTESVLQLLGKHLTNAYNQFSNVSQSFNLIGQKLSSTKQLSESTDELKNS
jgi:DNA recombination protein RmuC